MQEVEISKQGPDCEYNLGFERSIYRIAQALVLRALKVIFWNYT